MPKMTLSEVKEYSIILERFGEPIGDAPSTIGVPDEREEIETLSESRLHVGQQEILEMWENLYEELGQVNLEELANWLGTSESTVRMSLPHRLQIIENDEIIEKRFIIETKKKKAPSKSTAKSWIKGTKKFSDKVKKAKSAGMDNPEGFAAWMQHKATGKWPNKD